MSFNRAKFLIEVLGPDGARALAKAASRSEYLAQMVVPRTILAWLEAAPSFEGTVPGLDACALTFQKAEDGFTGCITLAKDEGPTDYHFEAASIFHVAGAVATAMELDSLMFGNARNTELNRLGKSIDMMAKMRFVGQTLEKGLASTLLKPVAGVMNAIDSKITPQGRQQAGRQKLSDQYGRLNAALNSGEHGPQPVLIKPHPTIKGSWAAYDQHGAVMKNTYGQDMHFEASVPATPARGAREGWSQHNAHEVGKGANNVYHSDNLDTAARHHELTARFEANGPIQGLVTKFHIIVPKDPIQHESERETGLINAPPLMNPNPPKPAIAAPKHEALGAESQQMQMAEKDPSKKSGKCSECGATKGGHFDRLVAGLVLKCKNSKPKEEPKLEKKALGEGSGKAAGPVAPAAPQAPTALAPPATTPQKLPKKDPSAKPPKPVPSSTVKLTRSEAFHNCTLCAKSQFHDGKFVGCLCFSALAKSVKANWHPDETVDLTFGSDWDRESVLTLLEAFGRS